MQPDYSQFWQPHNHNGQSPDVHFYDFFEDSLNQFISTNSGIQSPVVNNTPEQTAEDLKRNE